MPKSPDLTLPLARTISLTGGALFWGYNESMPRRSTRRRYGVWERIKVHPRRDREKIVALKGDMVRAFMKGDLETYWKLDGELRWILTQGKSG